MNASWIVTANAGRARFFAESPSDDRLEEINDMINTAARLRTADTESDRLGATSATKTVHNSGGAAPNKTYEPHQTPAEHQTEIFAQSVADYLLHSYQEGRFDAIALAASPSFLGVLRKLLDPQIRQRVKLEINKDYTESGPLQLRALIEAHAPPH